MKLKIITSFLLTFAIILSQTIPSVFLIPDFNAIMLILIIIINNDGYKKTLMYGVLLGLLSALSTKTPNGQIPILVCKIITANVVYLLMITLKNKSRKLKENIILFIGIFVDTIVYFLLWFWANGMSILNLKGILVIIDLVIIILVSAIGNSSIGMMILKLLRKCLKYDEEYCN